MAANIATDNFRLGQFNNGNSITNFPVNWPSDALYALLVNSTGDGVADNTKRGDSYESDINANEITGTNYTARGAAIPTLAATQASHVVTLGSASVVWNTATFSANGVWVIKHAATAGASPLISYHTFAATITATGAAFTITVASGWIQVSGG